MWVSQLWRRLCCGIGSFLTPCVCVCVCAAINLELLGRRFQFFFLLFLSVCEIAFWPFTQFFFFFVPSAVSSSSSSSVTAAAAGTLFLSAGYDWRHVLIMFHNRYSLHLTRAPPLNPLTPSYLRPPLDLTHCFWVDSPRTNKPNI